MDRRNPFGRISIWCGVLLSSPVQAEENAGADTLEPITVKATRTATSVEDSPRPISTIEADQIAERPGIGGIQSLLAEIPGIQYARSGGLGGQLVIRGFNTNQSRALLAIDGDRYRGRNTLEFNMLEPDSIERIEVIRGAASALFGADAMTGVINVVTRRSHIDPNQAFQLSPHLRALSWSSGNNLYGGRVELAGGGNGLDILIGAHGRHADDYRTPLGDAKNSDFQTSGGDFNIGYSPDADSRWEISGRYQNVTTGRAGGLGAAPGEPWKEIRESPIIERYLRLAYQGKNLGRAADNLEATIYVRDFETDIYARNRINPKFDVYDHTQVNTPTIVGGHVTTFKQLGEHTLSYGGDYSYTNFESRQGLTRRYDKQTGAEIFNTGWRDLERGSKQFTIGAYINDDWHLSRQWTVTGALRGDWIKIDIGSAPAIEKPLQSAAYKNNTGKNFNAVTGSLGTVFKMTPAWHLVANFSRGFRPPTGHDLTLTTSAGTITTLPSPNLDPETNLTGEAGVRWVGKRGYANLTAYQSKYKDLIALVPVGKDVRQRQNINKATVTGVELEGRYAFDANWSVGLSATYTQGTDDTKDRPLPEIAPLTTQLSLRYQGQAWYGEGVWRAYLGKSRIDDKVEREGSGYAMLDLYAGMQLSKLFGNEWRQWKVVAGVENVFDQVGRNPTVAEDLAFPQGLIGNPLVEPGRTAVLKLTVEY